VRAGLVIGDGMNFVGDDRDYGFQPFGTEQSPIGLAREVRSGTRRAAQEILAIPTMHQISRGL
jgi:hypothetical protein